MRGFKRASRNAAANGLLPGSGIGLDNPTMPGELRGLLIKLPKYRRPNPGLIYDLMDRGARLPTLPPAPPARLTKRRRRRLRGRAKAMRRAA